MNNIVCWPFAVADRRCLPLHQLSQINKSIIHVNAMFVTHLNWFRNLELLVKKVSYSVETAENISFTSHVNG